MTPTTFTLCADGACSGNPGPGGWAYELWDGEPSLVGDALASGAGGALHTTNNRMELQAAIEGLQAIHRLVEGPAVVRLRFDSEYVLKGLFEWMTNWTRRGWRTSAGEPVKNADQWRTLDAAREALRGKGIALKPDWVRGHASDPGNERVDRMAARERDRHAALAASSDTGGAEPVVG